MGTGGTMKLTTLEDVRNVFKTRSWATKSCILEPASVLYWYLWHVTVGVITSRRMERILTARISWSCNLKAV